MSDLTEFLLARVAEDEGAGLFRGYSANLQGRVLAESEAKRRLVECVAPVVHAASPSPARNVSDEGEVVLRILATVYANHIDYREEWKP